MYDRSFCTVSRVSLASFAPKEPYDKFANVYATTWHFNCAEIFSAFFVSRIMNQSAGTGRVCCNFTYFQRGFATELNGSQHSD